MREGRFIEGANTAHTLLEAAVSEVLDSRSNYDGKEGTDHTCIELSLALYRAVYNKVQFDDPACGYVWMACIKMARAVIAARRGEFHTDSALDYCGYLKLAAESSEIS